MLDEFHAWLEQQAAYALPKSLFGQAVEYCLNQWEKLTAFVKDGRLELDNNRRERSIKPFIIGRKNWLFANTPRWGTLQRHHLQRRGDGQGERANPFAYLPDIPARTASERGDYKPDDPGRLASLVLQPACDLSDA